MSMVLHTTACSACALSKRKCGKQKPQCIRCRRRGIDCRYPVGRPSNFVLTDHLGETISEHVLEFPVIEPEGRAISLAGSPALSLPPEVSTTVTDQSASLWFTSPSTWEIRQPPRATRTMISTIDLTRFMNQVHVWLAQWVSDGSNPFIHHRLYRSRFPRAIQDAYTSLSCYIHRTPKNDRAIFQIIEDRATDLVKQDMTSIGDDPLEGLARVQALLIYQLIGLYDGNIRLRYVAEGHIDILHKWMRQLVQHASQAACLGSSVLFPPDDNEAASSLAISSVLCNDLLWYSWLLAESIRRTWLVVSGVQGIYLLIRERTAQCLGGMMVTTRRGFWEAESAVVWEKQCSGTWAGLMHLNDAEKLFADVPPDDINDFTNSILECAFGVEQMERWGIPCVD